MLVEYTHPNTNLGIYVYVKSTPTPEYRVWNSFWAILCQFLYEYLFQYLLDSILSALFPWKFVYDKQCQILEIQKIKKRRNPPPKVH